MTQRIFSDTLIRKYKSDPDFTYQTTVEPANSLWDRFWRAFWQMISRMVKSTGGGKPLVWAFRILLFAILALFVWQLTKMRASGLFSASQNSKMGYSVSSEDIHSIDFDKEISEAVASGNYRLAIRMLYLQMLKKLSDSGRITWRIDKTNLSYANELRQADFYPSFRRLTIQFENNWYGHIPIAKEEYEEVTGEFQSINSKLGG